MASNRKRKLNLFAQDPHCHWCGELTVLTSDKEIKGQPNPRMATVDHLISRYHPKRWVKAKPGEIRQVLACFECNNKRSAVETNKIPKHIVSLMGQGFSLNPRGRVFSQTVETEEEALERLKEHGIEILTVGETIEYKITTFSNSVLDRQFDWAYII